MWYISPVNAAGTRSAPGLDPVGIQLFKKEGGVEIKSKWDWLSVRRTYVPDEECDSNRPSSEHIEPLLDLYPSREFRHRPEKEDVVQVLIENK